MPQMSAKEFQQRTEGDGWRVLDGTAQAWFAAPSHTAGAALAERVTSLSEAPHLPDIDLRPTGVRVRLTGLGEEEMRLATAISTAAREVGLTPDSSVLQVAGVAIDSSDPTELMPFWRTVMTYRQSGEARLADPLRRDPAIMFHRVHDPRPLRSRFHVDVGRPPEEVASAVAELRQTPSGPYGLMVSDEDGNEVDLVPGGPMSDALETADWRAPFAAMVFYPTATPEQASAVVTAVAGLADETGIPLLIDLRPDGVIVDSGKDLWEGPEGPLSAFTDLAARIQTAARGLGLSPDPARPRFVQLCLDVVDLSATREFWTSALGYQTDPREDVTDINDPRRLNPVLIFQRMDGSDEARRCQRDRIRMVLSVPHDQLESRIATALAAGGRVVETTSGGTRVSDSEGNELDLISGT